MGAILFSRKTALLGSRDVVDVDVLGGARAEHRLALIVVPQRGDNVRHDEVGRVLGDQLQHEHAVLTQVHLRELVRYLSILVVRRVHFAHYLHYPGAKPYLVIFSSSTNMVAQAHREQRRYLFAESRTSEKESAHQSWFLTHKKNAYKLKTNSTQKYSCMC